jgi:predicted esterase
MDRVVMLLTSALLALLAQAAPAPPASRPSSAPTPGQLVERIACPSDPSQTYTLYLPSGYTPGRRWPLLLVFDPRGRGTHAAALFRDAAERFGWIVASSDNTQSDGEWEPNRRALAAMWPDVRRAYAVDERRIYAAGFSGGAMVAWVLARSAGEGLAGIIAAGAPDPRDGTADPGRLAWFGSAGRLDFNFLEARQLDERMARAGIPHRLEFFDGAHQWLPAELAMRALGWLELLAMKDGRRTADPSLAAAIVAEDVAYGKALEGAGQLPDARRVYAAVAEHYRGVASVGEAEARARDLDAGQALEKARRAEGRSDDRERELRTSSMRTLGRLASDDVPLGAELVTALNVGRLRASAEGTTYEARAAARVLESIFVQTSFYIPRQFEEKKEYARAAAALEVATAIHPDRPVVWVNLAAARAMAGRRKPALAALEKALEAGFRNAELLRTDVRFASIREAAEFAALVAKIGGER